MDALGLDRISRTRPIKKVDRSVYDLSIERIRQAFDLHDHVAVSFSGGKDSTTVLNLALQVAHERNRLPLRVIFFDEEAIAYETEAYARRVSERPDVALEWYCVPVKHRNGCSSDSPFWYPWAPEDRRLWTRDLPPEAITEIPGYDPSTVEGRHWIPDLVGLLFPPSLGRCVCLLGIRADESMIRRRAVLLRRHDNWLIRDDGATTRKNLNKGYVIYDWGTSDVWTAAKRFGWDVNSAYDLMELAGIGHSVQRIAPPFGEQPMQNLFMWSICFPDLWEKMCDRVPGARTAARYARTELYSAGSRKDIQKRPDQTWQEAIEEAIERHPPEMRDRVAHRIASEIRLHHRKAGNDPILDVPHPWTGLNWRWLLRVAVRGDVKKRENPLVEAQRGDRVRVAEEYEIARKEWETNRR